MSFIQKLLFAVLPHPWADAVKRQSKLWLVICQRCGYTRNVWEMGGVRGWGVAIYKYQGIFCPSCKRFGLARVKKARSAPTGSSS